MDRLLRSPAAWIAALALVLSLLLLGHRGIWDPDEGRYTNVALNMLDSGDWLNPHRSSEVGHWTKPPLTYWAIASSVAVFGENAWAARLPAALSYLLCVWLAFRIARRLAPGSELQAALVYATMLFPIGAAQLITTDYVLAACEALAMWGFVEARFGAGRPRRWLLLMWTGFALAFLAKGPPGLLPLAAVAVFDLTFRERRAPSAFHWSGLLLFVALATPWYAAVMLHNPGLLGYFIGDEVVADEVADQPGRVRRGHGALRTARRTQHRGGEAVAGAPAAGPLQPRIRREHRRRNRRRLRPRGAVDHQGRPLELGAGAPAGAGLRRDRAGHAVPGTGAVPGAPAQRRRRTGIEPAGNRAISSPRSRIGAPGAGAHASAVIVSQLAGRAPSAVPQASA